MSKRSGPARKNRGASRRRGNGRPGRATPPGSTGIGGPSDLQTMLRQAIQLQRAGQWAQAQLLYRNVLIADPKNPKAMCGVAEAAARLGSTAEGVRLAQAAVQAHPEDYECQCVLARRFLAAGDAENALIHSDKAIEIHPRQGEALVVKSMCLERLGRTDEAIELVDKALLLVPGNVYPLTLKARYLTRKKDYVPARRVLEQVVSSPSLYSSLANTSWNQLGEVLDKLGEYEEAFEAYEKCGRITSETSLAKKCSPNTQLRMLEVLKAGVTPERFQRFTPDRYSEAGPAPAFLVGFPRSGTTLTEQMMAAHSMIETSDERPFMNMVRGEWARLVGGSDDVGGMIDRLTDEHVRMLREHYWRKVEAAFGTRHEGRLFVDKLPLNLVNIGLINLVFPDAKVLIALRDPRDVCLSCFMQDFALNNSMIHFLTLEGAARFYDRVMDFYLYIRPMLTLDWIEVRYEDTVDDPESQARRIFAHLGVPWEDGVLRFHEQARNRFISTPSYTSVSEPVHKGAVQRWKNYRKQISDVVPFLERYIREFGYELDADGANA